MKPTITSTIILSLLGIGGGLAISACDLLEPGDACDKTGGLYAALSQEGKDSCDECGDPTGCESDGDSGEEPDGVLSCIGDPSDSIAEFCVVGDPLPGNFWEPWHERDIADCHTPTTPVECVRSWFDPLGKAERECVLCEANIMAFELDIAHPTHSGGWPMCMTEGALSETYHKYRPRYDWGGYAPQFAEADWFEITGCSLDGDTYAGTCEPVLMDTAERNGPKDGFTTGLWTCACDTDNDCQLGAYCESGWIIDGGVPQPTLCTWDDGSGTANGIAPEGPIVYGLDAWADGIVVDGDAITLTPAMYIGLAQAALNDDQSFGLFGDLTHVGPDSLAAHLELRVGDIVQPDRRELDVLEGGGVAEIPVIRDGVVLRVLEVSLSGT